LKFEILVKTFIWAQWDMINQVLYHIHHRQISASVVTEGDDGNNCKSSKPTLSGLQFHDDLPHETVVSTMFDKRKIMSNKSLFKYIAYICNMIY